MSLPRQWTVWGPERSVRARISSPETTLWSLGARGVLGVHDVEVRRPHAGQDQVAPLLRGVAVAGRAGVPARVVKLVAQSLHLGAVDDRGVGRALGVHVHRGEVVGRLDAGAGVECCGVEQPLARGPHRCLGRGVAGSAAGVVGHRVLLGSSRDADDPSMAPEGPRWPPRRVAAVEPGWASLGRAAPRRFGRGWAGGRPWGRAVASGGPRPPPSRRARPAGPGRAALGSRPSGRGLLPSWSPGAPPRRLRARRRSARG